MKMLTVMMMALKCLNLFFDSSIETVSQVAVRIDSQAEFDHWQRQAEGISVVGWVVEWLGLFGLGLHSELKHSVCRHRCIFLACRGASVLFLLS